MTEAQELYQRVLLDHNRRPRGMGELDPPCLHGEAHNPLCGDAYQVWVRVDADRRIEEVRFRGAGCAVSRAAASMMTERIAQAAVSDALAMGTHLGEFLSGNAPAASDYEQTFASLVKFPTRRRCVLLVWEALSACLAADEAPRQAAVKN